MDYLISEKKSNLKSKEKFIKDDFFNLLVNIAVENHDNYYLHEIIKNLASVSVLY